MDAVFSFLFGTRTGFAILFAGGILLFAILYQERNLWCQESS